MKTRVIAIAPYDGWAFIVEDEKIYLLRPPYVLSKLDEVSQYEVENAISAHGFEECDITFDSIDEVIQFLKDQFVTLRKNQGIEIPSSEELRKLLEYAPKDVLLEYLRRAEEELIPKGKFEVAESIVSDLLKLKQVQSSPEMKRVASRIIEKCKGDRTQSPAGYADKQLVQKAKTISEFQREIGPRYRYGEIVADYCEDILPEDIQRIITETVEGKDQEEFSEVPRILIKNIKKAREKAENEKDREKAEKGKTKKDSSK